MKKVMLTLLEAQTKLLQDATGHPEVVQQLRETVPAPVLAHFLRLVAQGRKGVAPVRNGVCTQCHIRLPSGLAAAMVKTDEIHLCEQCGSFLVLVDEPAAPAVAAVKVPRARKDPRRLAA